MFQIYPPKAKKVKLCAGIAGTWLDYHINNLITLSVCGFNAIHAAEDSTVWLEGVDERRWFPWGKEFLVNLGQTEKHWKED